MLKWAGRGVYYTMKHPLFVSYVMESHVIPFYKVFSVLSVSTGLIHILFYFIMIKS